jgi:hypothetical protein
MYLSQRNEFRWLLFLQVHVLNRRHLIRGLGVALSLPLLDAMMPSVLAAPSKFRPLPKSIGAHSRLICCYIPNDVNILEWMPKNEAPEG